jgi:hypothetical protein
MPLGLNDPVPKPCAICGHLAMQHTRTSLGKRCIGNQWRCTCILRPMSMVLMGVVPPARAGTRAASTDANL